MKQKTYNFNQISQVRSVLFGISALLIVLFHSFRLKDITSVYQISRIINTAIHAGNIGVDFFLLLSGVGLYYSYSNNENTKLFYKRRVLRILPAWLIVATAYNGYLLIRHIITLKQFFSYVLLTAFFIDGDKNYWFFSLLVLLYVLYPPLYKLLKKHKQKGLIFALLIISTLLIVLYIFFPARFNAYEIAITRTFPFVLGAWLGKYIKENKTVRLFPLVAVCIAVLISVALIFVTSFSWLVAHYFVVRLLYCPVVIALTILLSTVIPKAKTAITSVLIFIGSLSCEIYLLYERLDRMLYGRFYKAFPSTHMIIVYYLLLVLITVFTAYLLNKVCKTIQNKLNSNTKHVK